MKQIVLIAFSFLFLSQVSAQESADIGIWGGAGSYFGDMTQIDLQRSLRPAYGGFLRYNFNPRYGVRLQYLTGDIRGEGEFEGTSWLFEKRVNDLSVMGEFNFFRYIMGNPKYSITTYLLGGFGASFYKYNYVPGLLYGRVGYLDNLPVNLIRMPDPTDPLFDLYVGSEENLLAFNTMVGFGFKFNIGSRWGVGMEAQLRKYYNDKLDNLDDPRKSYYMEAADPLIQDSSPSPVWTIYTDTWHNNDWIVHFGVHVTYKFYLGSKECPVYENLN